MNATLPQILVVNDNPNSLNSLARLLRHADYIVMESKTVEHCLRILDQLKPALILLDGDVLGEEGLEVCHRIKSIPHLRETPVLFLTYCGKFEKEIDGFVVGTVDFLGKPRHEQEIIAYIETHLALRQNKMEVANLKEQLKDQQEKRLVELHHESLWRRTYEQEVAKLLELVRHQGQQLGILTRFCMDSNSRELQAGIKALAELPQTYLTLLREHISLAQIHAETSHDKASSGLTFEHLSASSELLNTLEDSLAYAVKKQFDNLYQEPPIETTLAKLSAREKEILQLIANGNSNAETAEMLSLAEPTVRVYRSRIMGKLQLEDTTALIKFAIKHNLTTVT